MRFRHVIFPLALALGACADEAEPQDAAVYDISSQTSITAKAPGMTLWVSPVAVPDWRYEQQVWLIQARASKNLASAFSYASDDEFGEALLTSARKFEVVVDSQSMTHLLDGYPLYVELDAASGSQTKYYATLTLAPRFAKFSGSSKIFVESAITPAVVGGSSLFRGRVGLGSGVSGLAVAAGRGAAEPPVEAGNKWNVDLSWPNLMLATDPVGQLMHFTANGPSGPVAKDATIELAVASLTLDVAAPELPEHDCAPDVLACMEALPATTEDASSCGTAIAVKSCPWQVPAKIGAQRFAHDLTSYAWSWWSDHKADMQDNPLLEVLGRIHAGQVFDAPPDETDPTLTVLGHPDMAFESSDHVWYGSYHPDSGQLQRLWDFWY
jgi:hypothetical protein